jgi:polypeptide N-acetylgalactosaminyltransferase
MSVNRLRIKSRSLFKIQVRGNCTHDRVNSIICHHLTFQIARSKKSFGYCIKFVGTLILVCLVVMISIYKLIQSNNHPLAITQNFIYIEPLSSFFRKEHNLLGEKIDWHNYEYLEEEKLRLGQPGENGQPVYAEPEEEDLNKKLFDENGYFGLISDKIALNRSVSDHRHPQCKKLKYLKELPNVSIVIPFYNDHLSTLLRTVYSVINRSPKELLKEVILVNDHSTKDFLYGELEEHIKKHLKHIVKLYVLPRRSGLVRGNCS